MNAIDEYNRRIKATEQALENLKQERKAALFTTPLRVRIVSTKLLHDGTQIVYVQPIAMRCTRSACTNNAEITKSADGNYYNSRNSASQLGYGPLCSYHAYTTKFEW